MAFAAVGCGGGSESDNRLYVTIHPLRSIVGAIVGDDFDIDVLVPEGAGPETFEPSARQFVELNSAQLIFGTGLIDFEKSLLERVQEPQRVVVLHHGIELMEGSCSHSHAEGHHHAHGTDPHIWTSPRALQVMASNAYNAIHALYPDSVKYEMRHEALQRQLRELDARTAEKIIRSGRQTFIIYHPALTYYARDYGIRQVAIESDGKEPSAKRLAEIIDMARAERIARILYQSQYPASTVEAIARDIEAQSVAINPLAEDVVANIDAITDIITAE